MKLETRLFFSFCLLCFMLFSGCIPVDDISEVWEEATLDPNLEGHWKQLGVEYRSQDQYISFLKKEDVYEIEMTDAEYTHLFDDLPTTPKPKTKCLRVNDWGVLVIDTTDITKKFAELDAATKEETKKTDTQLQGGGIDLYKIKDNALSLYRLKADVLKKAITSKKVDGTIDPNEIPDFSIKKVNIDTIKYITTLADQVANIEQVMKYERVQDLQESLKKSKEYPTTNKTPQNTLINVDFPELKYFAEGKTQILLDQLSASPEWEIKDFHGEEIICSRRTYRSGKWQAGSNGYESTFDEGIYDGNDFYQIRYLFRFSKEPYGFHAVWAKSDHVMKLGPEIGEINLKLKLNDQGIMSYIAIGQEGLWFEFYEQREKEPRIHTQKALAWLKKFLQDVKAAEEEIQKNGYAKDLLPPNSMKVGKSSIDIQQGSGGTSFTIIAWINPQKSGHVYLKLFDNVKNKQQSAHTIKFVTNEFIGYSSDPNELFPYNCSVSDYDNEWDSFDEARFEIWHHPNNGEEVKLIGKKINLHQKQM